MLHAHPLVGSLGGNHTGWLQFVPSSLSFVCFFLFFFLFFSFFFFFSFSLCFIKLLKRFGATLAAALLCVYNSYFVTSLQLVPSGCSQFVLGFWSSIVPDYMGAAFFSFFFFFLPFSCRSVQAAFCYLWLVVITLYYSFSFSLFLSTLF